MSVFLRGESIDDLIEAANLAAKIKKKIPGVIDRFESGLELAKWIEEEARKGGMWLSFPVNIGIDSVAAHFTPTIEEPLKLEDWRCLKIDFGISKNFWPSDTAITLCNDREFENLCSAAKNAVIKAIEYIEKEGEDAKILEIGRIISEEIKKMGFKPIQNLTGHEIWRNNLHAGKSIYNVPKGSGTLGSGIFAIEPFATTGIGLVRESKPSGIYRIILARERIPLKIRIPELRKLATRLIERFGNLPFSVEWLEESEKEKLKFLIPQGVVRNYRVLVEVSNGFVSQFEETVVVIGGEVIVPTAKGL